MARKTVAALQGVVLVVAGAGVLPYGVTVAAVAAALGALVWSFGRDILWLRRHGARPRAAEAARAERLPRTLVGVAPAAPAAEVRPAPAERAAA